MTMTKPWLTTLEEVLENYQRQLNILKSIWKFVKIGFANPPTVVEMIQWELMWWADWSSSPDSNSYCDDKAD